MNNLLIYVWWEFTDFSTDMPLMNFNDSIVPSIYIFLYLKKFELWKKMTAEDELRNFPSNDVCEQLCVKNVGKVNMELPTRCNNNSFIDLQDQLNMFRANFAHLQERKTETFTTYGTMSCYVECRVSGRVAWHYLYVCVTVYHML
jgi:hypothetical protein